MEINKHIVLTTGALPELTGYLKDNRIACHEGSYYTSFDIYESSPHWEYIQKFIYENGLLCQSNPVFLDNEVREAEWMRIWCQWRCGYPQPEDAFMTGKVTYSREKYCHACDCGEVQIEPFRMKKEPKWGKRHFAELNWVGDELFLSKTAKNALESNHITGISFLPVNNKKGNESFDDIFQLVVPCVLDAGMVEELTDFDKISYCSNCSKKKYVPSGTSIKSFRKEIFSNAPEVVKTFEIFRDMRYAAREIIVHQRVYRVITENNLERGLVFEPIRLV